MTVPAHGLAAASSKKWLVTLPAHGEEQKLLRRGLCGRQGGTGLGRCNRSQVVTHNDRLRFRPHGTIEVLGGERALPREVRSSRFAVAGMGVTGWKASKLVTEPRT